MSHLRKEKEEELFQQFQRQQERMADLLQSQRQQERNTEDEAIARAMEEQYAKKEVSYNCTVALKLYAPHQQAELEKQRLFMERTRDIQNHRLEMIAEREHCEKEEEQANKEMLEQKRAHDLKVDCSLLIFSPLLFPSQFHQTQQEKAARAFQEARELQHFLLGQVAGREEKKRREEREDRELNNCNQKLLEVMAVPSLPH